MSLYIPDHIDYDPNLTVIEKYLFGLITGLSKKEGYCYMSNAELGERMGLEQGRVSKIISKLAQMEYLVVSVERIKKEERTGTEWGTRRKIFLFQHPGANGGSRKRLTGVVENDQYSNKEIELSSSSSEDPIENDNFEEPRKLVPFSKTTQTFKRTKKERRYERESVEVDPISGLARSLVDNLPPDVIKQVAKKYQVTPQDVEYRKAAYIVWVQKKNVLNQDMKLNVESFIITDLQSGKLEKQLTYQEQVDQLVASLNKEASE